MAEVKTFRGSVLKIGSDGSSLARNIFTTDTRLCVALPGGGGVTRTILLEKVEAVSLSLAPAIREDEVPLSSATEAAAKKSAPHHSTSGSNAATSDDDDEDGSSVVVIMTFRVVAEPVLVLRLPSESAALNLVKALKQSPRCEASFHTPNWTYVSPTRRERADTDPDPEKEKEEEDVKAARNARSLDDEETRNGQGPTQRQRGPSTASTQEGPRDSKTPTAPSPPSPLSSSTSTSPGGDGVKPSLQQQQQQQQQRQVPDSAPQPERALAGESSFAVTSEDGGPTEEQPPLEDLVGDGGGRNGRSGSVLAAGRGSGGVPSKVTPPPPPPPSDGPVAAKPAVTAPVPTMARPTPRAPTEADVRGTTATRDLVSQPLLPPHAVRTWTPPRPPSYWGPNTSNTNHNNNSSSSGGGGGGHAAAPMAVLLPVRGAARQPPHQQHRSWSADLVTSPQQQQPLAEAQEIAKDDTIAELRRALRIQEEVLQQLLTAQEEAREAVAARAQAEKDCAHLRESLKATEQQLDRVSRSFTEVLRQREAELQQQHRAELDDIQDAFDTYDKRMNSFVDQMQKDFDQERRQWRQERQVLQSLLERQHTHMDSLLAAATSPPPHAPVARGRHTDGSADQAYSPAPLLQQQQQQQRQRPDHGAYDTARERVEARLRTYAENRHRQQQQQQQRHRQQYVEQRHEGTSALFRRAIQTPSPTK